MADTVNLQTASLFSKLRYYAGEQGLLHAIAAGLGRKSFGFWRTVGPLFTAQAFQNYKARHRSGPTLLNLGGGSNRLPAAFSVDVDARSDAYVDVTKPLPFPDRSFSSIFCEEVIEHVNREQGARLLQECSRILEPGGLIRLTTPDLMYFCSEALANDRNGQEINKIFYGHGHQHIYSNASLEAALSQAGFRDIRFGTYKDKNSRLGQYDSHADRFNHPPEISLYVEAIAGRAN